MRVWGWHPHHPLAGVAEMCLISWSSCSSRGETTKGLSTRKRGCKYLWWLFLLYLNPLSKHVWGLTTGFMLCSGFKYRFSSTPPKVFAIRKRSVLCRQTVQHIMFGADCIRLHRKLRLRSTAWLLDNCTHEGNVTEQGCTSCSFYKPVAKQCSAFCHAFIPGSCAFMQFPLSTWPTLSHAALHNGASWEASPYFPNLLLSQAGGWLPSQMSSSFAKWILEDVLPVLGTHLHCPGTHCIITAARKDSQHCTIPTLHIWRPAPLWRSPHVSSFQLR